MLAGIRLEGFCRVLSYVRNSRREEGRGGPASETLRLAFVRIAGVCAYTDRPMHNGIMLTRPSVPPAHDILGYTSSHVQCAWWGVGGAVADAVICDL